MIHQFLQLGISLRLCLLGSINKLLNGTHAFVTAVTGGIRDIDNTSKPAPIRTKEHIELLNTTFAIKYKLVSGICRVRRRTDQYLWQYEKRRRDVMICNRL